jgi:hypothetical protein
MTNVMRGQVWRNVHGAHVKVFGIGPCRHDTEVGEALWVDVCDADGNVTGSRIPMELAFGCSADSLWTLVGEVA